MSASQREKGAVGERQFVKWLRESGRAPDARRYLAGDGRQPGDIDAFPGLVLDVKVRARCEPGTWKRQAETEAGPHRLGAVVYHPPGVSDPGQWIVMLRVEEFLDLWSPDARDSRHAEGVGPETVGARIPAFCDVDPAD